MRSGMHTGCAVALMYIALLRAMGTCHSLSACHHHSKLPPSIQRNPYPSRHATDDCSYTAPAALVAHLSVAIPVADSPYRVTGSTVAFRRLQESGCTEPYGQCGGQTCSNGAQSCTDSAYTCCPSNYSCQRQSQWYWQCQPAAATYASGMSASFTDCIGASHVSHACSCKGMLVSIFITRQLVHYVGQPALCKSACTV